MPAGKLLNRLIQKFWQKREDEVLQQANMYRALLETFCGLDLKHFG